jgi:hypothetical protein
MYFLGQLVKIPDDTDFGYENGTVGIVIRKGLIKPSNKDTSDEYYGVLCHIKGKDPEEYLFKRGQFAYCYDSRKKVYFGKTKTNKICKFGSGIKIKDSHKNELHKFVNSELTKLNEVCYDEK